MASLVTAVCCLLLSSSPARTAEIVVGANIGNVPWEFQSADGEFVGFEIDLVMEVAKRLGKSVEIVNIPFNGLFSAVQSGRIIETGAPAQMFDSPQEERTRAFLNAVLKH